MQIGTQEEDSTCTSYAVAEVLTGRQCSRLQKRVVVSAKWYWTAMKTIAHWKQKRPATILSTIFMKNYNDNYFE